jgi:hypothetical protein
MSNRIELAILDEANYQVRRLQEATPALNAELRQLEAQEAEIERRKAEIKAQLEAARLAHKRLLNFRPCIGTDFQCPRCGIVKEIGSTLRPIPSSTSDDIMRCGTCGLDVIIPGR